MKGSVVQLAMSTRLGNDVYLALYMFLVIAAVVCRCRRANYSGPSVSTCAGDVAEARGSRGISAMGRGARCGRRRGRRQCGRALNGETRRRIIHAVRRDVVRCSVRSRDARGRGAGWRQRTSPTRMSWTRGAISRGGAHALRAGTSSDDDGLHWSGIRRHGHNVPWAQMVYRHTTGGAGAAVCDAMVLATAVLRARIKVSGPPRRRGGALRGAGLLRATVIGLMMVTRRIGEASNPGLALWAGGFDDPEGGVDMQSYDDEECDDCGPPPPLTDDGPWDEELADTMGPDGADRGSEGDGAGANRFVPDFVSARKFLGARKGMKFTMGDHGLGYYRDAPPVLELAPILCPPIGVAPLKLSLDQMLKNGATSAEDAVDEDPEAAARGSRRKRGPRRARTGLYSCNAGEVEEGFPVWLEGHEVDASDRTHRRLGLWAVDSVNPNAWPAGHEYAKRTAADFLVMQEVKLRAGDQLDSAEAAAKNSGWDISIAAAIKTVKGAASAGVGVGTKKHIGMSLPSVSTRGLEARLAARFTLRHIGAVCRGGFHLGSVYLCDSVGCTADENLDYLQGIAGVVVRILGMWVLGGDWNCTPEELASTGWLNLVGG